MKASSKYCGQCLSSRCCSRRVRFQALIIFMLLITIIYYFTTDSHDIPIHEKVNFLPTSVFTRIYSTATNVTSDIQNSKVTSKLVLLWFPFFSKEQQLWTLHRGSLDHCPVKNCVSTFDRSRLLESDAVVVHITHPHMDQRYPVLPHTRHPHQRWVLFTIEPPQHVMTHFSLYNNQFNWTATFRTDSDIPVYYGRKQQHNRTNEEFIYKNQTMLEKEKPRLVAWICSNFVARSNRMRFVRELQWHITVDVYGSVSSLFKHNALPCDRYSPACNQLLHQYKFYLALENNNCRDYITEKFWVALERGLIPVVMGGEWYKKQAPPFSYIDIHTFSSTKSLAQYLIKVANDVDLFNSYMQWRYSYRIIDTDMYSGVLSQWGCDLCKALNNPALPAQVYTDLPGWYAEDEKGCSTYSVWERLKRILNILFFRLRL